MLCKLHSVYKIIHCIHRGSQIIIHYTVKGQFFAFNLEKKLHQAENIYTDTVCGVCDKYEVWPWSPWLPRKVYKTCVNIANSNILLNVHKYPDANKCH